MIRSKTHNQDLSVDAFNYDFNFSELERACSLMTVYIHASTPILESVTVKYKSSDGEDYTTLIHSRLLYNETDYVFASGGEIVFNAEDSITVGVTNANGIGEVFVTIKVELKSL